MQQQNIRTYFIAYTIILLFSVSLFFSLEHGELVIRVNEFRNGITDLLMRYLTFLGDGIVFGIVVLIMLIKNRRVGIFYLTTALTTLVSSSFLKRVVFSDIPRPKKYFEGIYELNFVEGVDTHGKFSFPSGHTMSVFAMATVLALTFSEKKWVPVILTLVAWTVGFSRIYLLQHFLRDVIAGSLIGVSLSVICFLAFKSWLDKTQKSDYTSPTT